MIFILKKNRTFFVNFLLWIAFSTFFFSFHFQRFDSLFSFIIFISGIILFQIQFFFLNFKTTNYLQLFLFYFFIICFLKSEISTIYSLIFVLSATIYFLFLKDVEFFKYTYFNLGVLLFSLNYFFFPSIIFTFLSIIHGLLYTRNTLLFTLIQFIFGFIFGFIIFYQLNFLLEWDSLKFSNLFHNKTLVLNHFDTQFLFLIPLLLILIISIWDSLDKSNKIEVLKKNERNVLFLSLIFIFLAILFFREIEYTILYLIFPSSLIIGQFFHYQKKWYFSEIIFFIIVISSLLYSNIL